MSGINLSAEQQQVIYKALFEFGMVLWKEVGKDLAVEALKSMMNGMKKGGAANKMIGNVLNAFSFAESPKELDVQKFRIIDNICEPLKDTDNDGVPDIKDPCINDPDCK